MSLWRYGALLPAAPPEDAASGPGFTPLVPAPRLASAIGVGELLAEARPRRTRRTRSRTASSRSRPRRRASSGMDTLSATSTGNLANAVAARAAATGMRAVIFCPAGLEPEKLAATTVYGATVYGVRGSLRRLLAPRQRVRRRGRLGHRQREPALVLRRGLEDARVRDRRAARLGDAGRGRDADRLRRDVHEGVARLPAVRAARPDLAARSRSCTAARPRAAPRSRRRSPRTGASRRCGRTRWRRRSRSATRPTATSTIEKAKASGGGVFSVPEDEIGSNISLLAEHGRHLRRGRDGRRDRRAARGRAARRAGRVATASSSSSRAPA